MTFADALEADLLMTRAETGVAETKEAKSIALEVLAIEGPVLPATVTSVAAMSETVAATVETLAGTLAGTEATSGRETTRGTIVATTGEETPPPVRSLRGESAALLSSIRRERPLSTMSPPPLTIATTETDNNTSRSEVVDRNV